MERGLKRFYAIFLTIVLLGSLASLSVLWERHLMEQANCTTELLSDYRSLNDFARLQGLKLDDVLRQVKEMGVTCLAVDELTRDDLQTNGWARCLNSYEVADLQYQGRLGNGFVPQVSCVYFEAASADIAARLCDYAGEVLGSERVTLVDEPHHLVALEADNRQVGTMGFGVPSDVVKHLVDDYGFRVWVRPWNSPFFGPDNLRKIITSLAQPGVEGVIFGGLRNEVLGFPKNLDMVGEMLDKVHLKIGVIELPRAVQQRGIETLARRWPERVVRVQSVSPAQQAKTHPQVVAAMYGLGARERNIRLLYVRPYNDTFDKLTAPEATELLFTTIVSDLSGRLGSDASLFPYQAPLRGGFNGDSFRLLFIALGISSALCLLVRQMVRWPLGAHLAFVTLIGFVTLGVTVTGIGLGYWRLLLGLTALVVFPVWGLVLLFPVVEKYHNARSVWRMIYAGWKVLLIASAFSLVGGLMGASCLPQTVYMLSVDVFRGVKLHSLMVPALTILAWIVFQHRNGAFRRVRQIVCQNVKIWHLLVFLFLLLVFAFYLVRTGNSGGDMVVSDSERALRRWLDIVLGVRPRFKEFLLGNPLLLCLPTLVMCRWRGFIPFAVLAAALGEASLAGTYAHLHTPLTVSLQRSVLGVLIGGAFGSCLALLVVVADRLGRRLWNHLGLAVDEDGEDN